MQGSFVSKQDDRRARQLKSARRIYDRALEQVTALKPSTLARFDKAAEILSRAEGLALRAVPDQRFGQAKNGAPSKAVAQPVKKP